jgi:hypothetical protein
MTSQDATTRSERGLAVATLVGMASGLVVALADIASVPWFVVLAAAALFILSIVMFGVLTYRNARSSGSPFGNALHRSVRTAGKALLALMP